MLTLGDWLSIVGTSLAVGGVIGAGLAYWFRNIVRDKVAPLQTKVEHLEGEMQAGQLLHVERMTAMERRLRDQIRIRLLEHKLGVATGHDDEPSGTEE